MNAIEIHRYSGGVTQKRQAGKCITRRCLEIGRMCECTEDSFCPYVSLDDTTKEPSEVDKVSFESLGLVNQRTPV